MFVRFLGFKLSLINALLKEPSVFKEFWLRVKWRLDAIEEPYTKPEERIDNAYQLKKQNKNRQKLSKWSELLHPLEKYGVLIFLNISISLQILICNYLQV